MFKGAFLRDNACPHPTLGAFAKRDVEVAISAI